MSTLVLVRHGKTEWSSQNRFAGWADAPLSAAGRQEAQGAGRVLAAAGYRFELACTSYLSRAAETLDIILEEIGRPTPPVERSWRLNERNHGGLQGHNRAKMALQPGHDSVAHRRRRFPAEPAELGDGGHGTPALEPPSMADRRGGQEVGRKG